MAKVTVEKINAKEPRLTRPEHSQARLSAKKIGLEIPKPEPSLPETEQEESDIA